MTITPPYTAAAVNGATTITLWALFGYDTSFWAVVIPLALFKIATSERERCAHPHGHGRFSPKIAVRKAAMLAMELAFAIIPTFLLTKILAKNLGVDAWGELLLAVALVLTGHGFILYLEKRAADPETLLFEIIKIWRNK